MMVHDVSDSNLKDSSLLNHTICDQSPRPSPDSRSEFCPSRCSSWYQDTKAKLEGDVARLKVRQQKRHFKSEIFFRVFRVPSKVKSDDQSIVNLC